MPVCPKCGRESTDLGGKCPQDEYHFVPESAISDAKKDPVIGTRVAQKFVILSLISEGGMGAVYRALQLPVEREVAFKVLRAELKDSDQGKDRFIREARAVSRLTHPNIITLHDFGFDEDKHPYMVMEYAPGASLADWLKHEKLTTERIVHIIEQVLSALTDAHEQGIVHRDLKPENMIITKSGNDRDFVKLLDFGIARMINEGATRSLTREGEVFGTPHYMAPEQAQGRRSVGPPADVYAVGIMLYEMLTGRCPFDAPTPLSVLFMHINEPLPEIEPRAGVVVPETLRNIVRMATAKDADMRYQNAGEMLTAIENSVPRGASTAALLAVVGEPRTNTITPGSQPIGETTVPMRSPKLTPAQVNAANVAVFDPDPSIERDALVNAPEPYVPVEIEDTSSRMRTGLLAAIALLAIFLIGGVVYGIATDSDDRNVDQKTIAEPSEDAGTEPNVVDEKETHVAVTEKTKIVAEKVEPEAEPKEKPVEVVEKPEEKVDVVEEPVVEPSSEKTELKTKKTTKTVKREPKKVVPKEKPVEKPVEEKDPTKTGSPTKFKPKDNRKWGTP